MKKGLTNWLPKEQAEEFFGLNRTVECCRFTYPRIRRSFVIRLKNAVLSAYYNFKEELEK